MRNWTGLIAKTKSRREPVVLRESKQGVSLGDQERCEPGDEGDGRHFMEEKSEEEDDASEVEVEFLSGKERMKGEEYRDDEQRVEDRLWDGERGVEEKGGVDERSRE